MIFMPDIKVLVEGGKASAGAPLGPALGPLGVNIGQVVSQINEKTKGYAGMKVPVTVEVDASSKSFEIKVGSPPTSALIKKEISLDKGSSNPVLEPKGDISMQQVVKVAEMKIDNLASYKIKSAAKEVVGTCASMGVKVEGKPAKQALQEIDQGLYDSVFQGKTEKQTRPAEPKQEKQPEPSPEKKPEPEH
jgi:large subunit ribosomal protein L11